MIEIGARLAELEELGLRRKTRLVSGPQGPRVVLDGKPALLLCSGNHLGLADHPHVREACADAARRWGVGAGGPRVSSGTMTIHRRLEERLASFLGRQSALLFGSGFMSAVGVVGALARPGDVVFADELVNAALTQGCRLSRAETFLYDHLDVDHLAWGIAQADGRGALIVTDSVFALDGAVAPLADIVELAQRRRMRVVVDESNAVGALGPGGRGCLAQAAIADQADVIIGTLAKSLGSYGGFVACDREMAEYLVSAAATLIFSTAPPPPATAAGLTALGLLEQRPELVRRLQSNAALLRAELIRHGFYLGGSRTHIVPVTVGEPRLAEDICRRAFERGVFVEAVAPPEVPATESCLRLTPMASHRPAELRDAAQVLSDAARGAGFDPQTAAATVQGADFGAPVAVESFERFEAPEAPPAGLAIFDVEQEERLAA